MAKSKPPKDIDEYISQFPPDVQEILSNICTTIHNAAPDATEVISYQMPAFRHQHHADQSRGAPMQGARPLGAAPAAVGVQQDAGDQKAGPRHP